MDEYIREPIFARVSISLVRNDNLIYQTIRINPSKPVHLKYFLSEKYKVGRAVHDLLEGLYIGNGDSIMFQERKSFKNATIIKYRIDEEVPIDMKDQEYHIDGFKPRFDGCEGCAHLVHSKVGADRCKFYRVFLKRYKKSCQDFLEKGDDVGEI
jgi:hypothetical protein